MARVVFTANLQRLIDCPERSVDASTVMEALDLACAGNEALRGYVVDDQHRLRKHVIIFLDGAPIVDREKLSDPVDADTEIYIMQALSGG